MRMTDHKQPVPDNRDTDDVELVGRTVLVLERREPRDIQHRAVIGYDDDEQSPICVHVQRSYRIEDSQEFKRWDIVDWTDIPRDVQETIVDAVADADSIDDLDPELDDPDKNRSEVL